MLDEKIIGKMKDIVENCMGNSDAACKILLLASFIMMII